MRYNNHNNNFNIGNLLLVGTAAFGLYQLDKYITSKYFQGKTEEEINEIVYSAFEKIKAYAELAKDGSEMLRNLAYNLRYGYTRLSVDNVTPEKLQKLWDIAENIKTVTENDTRIAVPVDIIEESLKLMLPHSGENNE